MNQRPTSFPKEKLKILLLEDIHPKAIEYFNDSHYLKIEKYDKSMSEKDLIKHIKGVHILGIRSKTMVTKNVLDVADKLLAIGCFCIGTNQVDLQNAALKGVSVFNSPYSNTRSVAELIIGEVILLMRLVISKNTKMHQGIWEKSASNATEIRGKTIGIVGYGHIGSQVSILAEAMGMKVCFFDVESKLPLGNANPTKSLSELFSKSDVVTFHVPENKSTFHLLNAKNIALIKQNAIVINYSRGNVIDLNALKNALIQNKIKGAAIDVYPEEPVENKSEFSCLLQKLDNVILTPHIGGSTLEAQERIGIEVAQKLVTYIETGNTIGSCSLPQLSLMLQDNKHRILHIHYNKPGVLNKITTILSENKINISAQYLQTHNEIGYAVFDVDKKTSSDAMNKLGKIEETIKARILF